jgi:hypothetical protein
LPQVRLQELGLLVQLPPGHPYDAPAGGGEHAVANPILLEGVERVMHRAAVELDNEALIWPDAIDLKALYELVCLRERETGSEEECLEALLELASDDPRADGRLL